ncbi:MAG: HAD family hydrolase [Saprospiraceae bacterium]|nr:HAD family hydrolase [Saprospiraceae bacterium]
MSKTLLIFDIDGTLLYSQRRDSHSFALIYEKLYGRPFPTIDWQQYPHVTDTSIFATVIDRHFRRAAGWDEMESFQDHFVDLLLENRRHYPADYLEVPQACRAIEQLRADDRFVLGIATGGWMRPALLKLAHIGLNTEDMVMSFADRKHTREDIIGEVVSRVRATRTDIERIVYVGDAPWDVETTRRLQMNFVGVRWRGDHDVLAREGAAQVITDYRDFPGFLMAVDRASPPRR